MYAYHCHDQPDHQYKSCPTILHHWQSSHIIKITLIIIMIILNTVGRAFVKEPQGQWFSSLVQVLFLGRNTEPWSPSVQLEHGMDFLWFHPQALMGLVLPVMVTHGKDSHVYNLQAFMSSDNLKSNAELYILWGWGPGLYVWIRLRCKK